MPLRNLYFLNMGLTPPPFWTKLRNVVSILMLMLVLSLLIIVILVMVSMLMFVSIELQIFMLIWKTMQHLGQLHLVQHVFDPLNSLWLTAHLWTMPKISKESPYFPMCSFSSMKICPIFELGNKHLFDDALLAILLPFLAPRTDHQSVQASV